MAESNKTEDMKTVVFALKNLCISELANKRYINRHTICGYTRDKLRCMLEKPFLYTPQMLSIIRFMYLHSGYFKKIIQYFVNLPKADCWTIDTEMKSHRFSNVDKDKIKTAYFKYINEVNSYNLNNELSKINTNVFLYDICCAYIVDTDEGKCLYYFDPLDCVITGRANGVLTYGIRKPDKAKLESYPVEIQLYIQSIINQRENQAKNPDIYPNIYPWIHDKDIIPIPYEKSFCVKYHDNFDFICPPFFFIIEEILDIDDFKDLEKTKAENDVYKIVALEIPTTDAGQIAIGDDLVTPFADLARESVSETIAIMPTPFKATPIEFTASATNNISNTQNAIEEFYSELGISHITFSGATNAAVLKINIEVNAGECYRILKQISRQINFLCRFRLPLNRDYEFKFRYLDVTAHNQNDKIDELLKLAQASIPVKGELLSALGNNPAKMYGNSFMENDILQLGESWQPLKSSYTMSGSDEAGRPTQEDVTDVTQIGRDNDSNDPDNRT